MSNMWNIACKRKAADPADSLLESSSPEASPNAKRAKSKEFECETCKKFYTSRSSLKAHIKRMHSSENSSSKANAKNSELSFASRLKTILSLDVTDLSAEEMFGIKEDFKLLQSLVRQERELSKLKKERQSENAASEAETVRNSLHTALRSSTSKWRNSFKGGVRVSQSVCCSLEAFNILTEGQDRKGKKVIQVDVPIESLTGRSLTRRFKYSTCWVMDDESSKVTFNTTENILRVSFRFGCH